MRHEIPLREISEGKENIRLLTKEEVQMLYGEENNQTKELNFLRGEIYPQFVFGMWVNVV